MGDRDNQRMTHDELLAEIDSYAYNYKPKSALRAVVELIQEKQKFLENTQGDIPLTNRQLGARAERINLLFEFEEAIEKELE